MTHANADAGPSHRQRVILWTLALVLTAAALVYQRRTGPTQPRQGTFTLDRKTISYQLIRTHDTTGDARITIPAPTGIPVSGTLFYKRYKTDDPLEPVPLTRTQEQLEARLPAQPAAGKLVYHLQLDTPGGKIRIPEDPGEPVVIRFKGAVPRPLLIAHIAAMILSILVGIRAGLAALFTPTSFRIFVGATLAILTAGSLVLGPLVQKYAFDHYWTGFPFGRDLTDNKALIMWLVWIAAAVVCARRPRGRAGLARFAVVLAMVVMMATYLIPHSVHGSELDYARLDRGVAPSEAIGTGD